MTSPNQITVNIDGISVGAVAAVSDAAASAGDLATAFAAAAADIQASMADASAAVAEFSATLLDASASMDATAASAATAEGGVATLGAASAGAAADVMTFSDALDFLAGSLESVLGTLEGLIGQAALFITVIAGWQILNQVSDWVQNLVQQMFQLDNQTQRVVNSWQYLFAQAPGGGKLAAQTLAHWAYQESPQLPFTAVDLRSGISTLGTIPGISPAEIEKFMPILADIASTLGASDFGGQGINLQQAAQAIVGAQFGLTRQLRYELHINPQELLKYGLVGRATATGLRITDPSTLIPAIEKWAEHRGLVGAATEQETSTFWGAFSSFQDYLQNALQTMGGIDPTTGGVMKGSMFGGISNILYGINAMLGQAQAGKGGPLQGVEAGVGHLLGGGVQSLVSAVQGMFAGLSSSGAGKLAGDLLQKLEDFGNWLESKPIQEDIKKIGEAIGQFAGQALQAAAKDLPDLEHAFQTLGETVMNFWRSMSPDQQQQIKNIGADLVELAAALVFVVASFVNGAALLNTVFTGITNTVESWGKNLANQFKQWGSDFVQMLIQGIESQISNFGGIVAKIANIPKSILGHSRPTEGPMVDDDEWMPHMMMMFAEGIQRGIPAVARASQQAAAAIGAPIGMVGHGVMYPHSTSYGPTTNYGGSTSYNSFYGSSMMELEMAIQRALADMDRRGALIMAAPGGRFQFGAH